VENAILELSKYNSSNYNYMDQPTKNTPKDAFLHLFNIFTFYLSVVAFITLLIQYVNKLFPDPLNYYFDGITNSVTWSSSVLLIAVPAFIITTWLLEKDIRLVPEKKDFRLRKWLLYFTLFLAAVTIIIDLMTFVYNFLQGELTIRFFLKVLVVLLVAGAVFAYYMWDLKKINEKTNMLKILATILSVVVLGSVIAGFFIVGSPQEQRRQKFDDTRIQNLADIQGQIVNYWQQKNILPEKLSLLQNDITGFMIPADPKTNEPYSYTIKSDLTFELCANFDTEFTSEDAINKSKYGVINSFPYLSQNWTHSTGKVCFERTIDPQMFTTEANLNPKVLR